MATTVYTHKGDRTLIKEINRQLVLHLIQSRGPISRKDIAEITGLSPAGVTGITASLIDAGIVREVGEAEGDGRAGRRAILLRLNPDAGCVVGVKLDRSTITCVLTDLDATVIGSRTIAVPFAPKADPAGQFFAPQAMIGATIDAIEQLLSEVAVNRSKVLGIGVGINGIVDTEAGVSQVAPHFGWRNVAFAAPLHDHFGIPVYLENDARTLTIAEQWFGAGRGVDHFVAIAVGYGIGSGIVANGQIYRGFRSGAGEVGHSVLQTDGPRCSCGKYGCLEAFAAWPAIERQIIDALAHGASSVLERGEALTLDAVARAADTGDLLAQTVLATAGRWLGIGLTNLVNILNPQLLILTGEAIAFGRWYFEPMEIALRAHAFAGLTDELRIVIEPGGRDIWARGAACVVLSNLFMSPVQHYDTEPRATVH